jgi:pyruvate kinase
MKHKQVGIIATIGPSTFSYKRMKALKQAGMTIARINTKYGDEKEWERNISNLRKLKVKILIDIKKESILPWLSRQKIGYVGVSFAESKTQIRRIKKAIPKNFRIISKIENFKAISNLSSLIEISDGIMVARGDLGKNIPLEKVPLFQKLIIKKCNKKRKIVITATEMLLSMVKSKIPERAEVSDVANAVLDGSDYLMLSEETAIGQNPVLALAEMKKIIDSTLDSKDILNI